MAYISNLSKDEQKKLARDKVDKALSRVHSDVVSIFNNDTLPVFLDFVARFHYFDIYNLILIYKQRPTATFIAPFKTWEKISHDHWHDPNRLVFLAPQKNQGIGILAPYILKKKVSDSMDLRTAAVRAKVVSYLDYHMVFVFDKEQTNGIPAPVVDWDLSQNKFDAEAAFNAFKAVAPFDIVFSTDSHFQGNYVFEDGSKSNGRADTLILNFKYRSDYSALCNFVIKPFVSVYLRQLGDRYTRDEFEKMSECVSYILARYFGLSTDGFFFFFVNSWVDDPVKMLDLLDMIRRAAHSIIELIEPDMLEYRALYGNNTDICEMDDDVWEFENLFTF